jgi:hypothetical protein
LFYCFGVKHRGFPLSQRQPRSAEHWYLVAAKV